MITLDVLTAIVRQAALLMQQKDFSIHEKGGYANIVTTTDVAVQEYLKRELSRALPGCGFLCEEEDRHSLAPEYNWIIDPIDGTANFSRGIAQCAICVGLHHGERMEMAVVYLPWTQELFTAERGKGACLNGNAIHVSERPFANAILCTALPVYYKEHARVCSAIIEEAFLQCNDIRRFGAAAPELCYLAMGRCELYFEYRLSPWDFAAASLILEEAGGVLCDLDGQPLDATSASGVLAANNTDNLKRLVALVAEKRKA